MSERRTRSPSGDYNGSLSPDMLDWYRKQYKSGTKVEILCYRRREKILRGIIGTVIYVDSLGTIHVQGTDGKAYDVKYMIDSCKPIE